MLSRRNLELVVVGRSISSVPPRLVREYPWISIREQGIRLEIASKREDSSAVGLDIHLGVQAERKWHTMITGGSRSLEETVLAARVSLVWRKGRQVGVRGSLHSLPGSVEDGLE